MPNKNGYVLSCVQGDNSDLFPDILQLYVPRGSKILDMTWGRGVFWKKVTVSDYEVVANDLDPTRGIHHYDCRAFPPEWEDCFDAVVFDPPYLHVGGFRTLKKSLDMGYNNEDRAIKQGIYGSKAVHKMYYDSMTEARRVLRPGGILILKCQDQIESGKQEWSHMIYSQYGVELGFYPEDQLILMSKVQPLMRHKPEQQKHARRNHSYFLVFRRMK